MKCLKENINDINSRYLLLITENDSSQEIIKYILDDIQETNEIKQEKKEKIIGRSIKYFYGSIFKSDRNNTPYASVILNQIKYEMGKDHIIVLKNLESVYPALYELICLFRRIKYFNLS